MKTKEQQKKNTQMKTPTTRVKAPTAGNAPWPPCLKILNLESVKNPQ